MEALIPVLTIAGSDCSGGAGIQADLKTIAAHGHYGMSVITAVTAQNTTGVTAVHDVPADIVGAQIDAVFTDIPPAAVKVGMVSDAAIIRTIAEKLKQYNVENAVIDPVMVATSGAHLLRDEAVDVLVTELLPLGRIITPNISEAEALSGLKIKSREDMAAAAEDISKKIPGPAVLVKGGHLENDAADLLYDSGKIQWYDGRRIETANTHGTGCTLSSAIACELAAGRGLVDAVLEAKLYLSGALRAGLNMGKGSGPVDHFYRVFVR